MNGTEVGVFKETNKVSFSSFLEGKDSTALESEFLLEIVSNFSNKSLEWELSDQELGRLLVFSDFTKSNCSRSESVGFLDTSSGGWGTFSGSLGSKVLSWGFSSGGFSSGLLCSCHLFFFFFVNLFEINKRIEFNNIK